MGEQPERPHLKVVKLDETEYWAKGLVHKDVKILGVYVFDANKHVHVASLTPSYELYAAYVDISESVDEETYDHIQNVWSRTTEPIDYMTVSQIDKLPAIKPGEAKQGIIDFGEIDRTYAEYEEEGIIPEEEEVEYLQGNPI